MWFSFLLELFSGIDNFWNCILVQMPRYRMFHSISSVLHIGEKLISWLKNLLRLVNNDLAILWWNKGETTQIFSFKKRTQINFISSFPTAVSVKVLGYQKRGKFREVGKKQGNHHAHLTVKFPTSFLKFCSKIHIHRFFSASHCQTI